MLGESEREGGRESVGEVWFLPNTSQSPVAAEAEQSCFDV